MWSGRLRTRKAAPITYWQEFVETDEWYKKELISDIPPEELHAALVDEDFSEDSVMLCESDAGDVADEGWDSSDDAPDAESDDVSYSESDEEADTSSTTDGGATDGADSDEEGSATEGE